MALKKSIENQISVKQKKMEEIAAEVKKLKSMQKAEERKNQTERAGKRGVLFEKLLPDTAKLDDAHFKSFLDRTVANDFGKGKLKVILAEQEKD